MAYISVDFDLGELSDNDIIDEFELRNLETEKGEKAIDFANSVYEDLRFGKDVSEKLRTFVQDITGRIL